jgi:hypothetical protein
MKKRFGLKAFIYFLCVSFLLMMNGFPVIGAEAKEKGIPIGEMVSKGEVKFEARENVWKEVESSHFPIFQGTRIKTEKGVAIITLSNNSQIEVGPNSLFYFDQNDRFILSQGNIEFRMPPSSEINFKAGDLSILKYRALQATKNPSVSSPKDEETMGSISIHSNGSVTVKSIQGKLSILNQDRVILAALSSKESLTIPNTTVKGPSRVMVAQHFPTTGGGGGAGGFLGLHPWDLTVAITAAFAFATLLTFAATSKSPEEGPRCFP